jgi:beta-glucanase (GH16 family)
MPSIAVFGVALALVLASSAAAQEWKLVWSDEFDGAGLPDPQKWDYEQGFVRNGEAQLYTANRKENARVEDGCLVIEGRHERLANPDYDPNAKRGPATRAFADYTAASVITKAKASWTYGRVEVRAKLPAGRGVWPAIWMLGENIDEVGWPACGEIDIMEFVGKEPDHIFGTVHWREPGRDHASKGEKLVTPHPSAAFHTYAIEWDADRIDFYFDENKYLSYPTRLADKAKGGNPFRKPHHLLINFAIGGSWGGPTIDAAVFPQRYLIDYVRIYQRP